MMIKPLLEWMLWLLWFWFFEIENFCKKTDDKANSVTKLISVFLKASWTESQPPGRISLV